MGRKDCVYRCVKKRKRDNSAALKKATEVRMKNRLNRVEEGSSTFRSDVVPSTSRTNDNSDSVTEVEKEHVAVDPGDLDESMKLSDSIDDYKVDGRRIIDFQYFWNQLIIISEHSEKFGCKLNYLKICKEKQVGFISKFDMKCTMCGSSFVLNTSDSNTTEARLDLNAGAVSGSIITGIGLSNLNEITASMDFSPVVGH